MVTQNSLRTYGVNQGVPVVKGITSKKASNPIFFSFVKDLFYFIRAQHVLNYSQYSSIYNEKKNIIGNHIYRLTSLKKMKASLTNQKSFFSLGRNQFGLFQINI